MSAARPLVSVVVPAYNHAGRLPDTLKSILAQDYPLMEVLVVDDGSTDRTAEAVKPFLADHPNLGYVRQKNRGVGQARNLGIAETKGELIAVCDADDLWLPNKLSLQAPLFDDPEVGLSYTDCVLLFPDGKEEPAGKRPVYHGHRFPELLLHNFVPCSSAVFRRSCLEKCGLFHPDKRMQGTADKHMWLKILLHYKIAGTGEPLLKLRKEYGSMSSNRDKMLLAELLCLDDIRSLCRALGREDLGSFSPGLCQRLRPLRRGVFLFRRLRRRAPDLFERALLRQPGPKAAYASGRQPAARRDFAAIERPAGLKKPAGAPEKSPGGRTTGAGGSARGHSNRI